MTTRTQRIREIVATHFRPVSLEIIDESRKHAGHAHRMGLGEGGETHFQLKMVSDSFAGLSRVSRSRAVHEALAGEFSTGLHALSLVLKTPEEAADV
jgi:BolA protein